MTDSSHVTADRRDVLLAEYAAANSIYLAYDGYRWQSGGFLIAGTFVFWGFEISATLTPEVAGIASLLVAGLMACWLAFAGHYRQLYLFKLHRLWEIEALLGMEQHRRFVEASDTQIKYDPVGISGHTIDLIVFLITALGGGILSWITSGPSLWNLVALPVLVVVAAGYFTINEVRTKRQRKRASA